MATSALKAYVWRCRFYFFPLRTISVSKQRFFVDIAFSQPMPPSLAVLVLRTSDLENTAVLVA